MFVGNILNLIYRSIDICSECNLKTKNENVEIRTQVILDLIHWARRYCDRRMTYASTDFNRIYKYIISKYPELKDEFDHTLMNQGKYWPYAQHGQYDETNTTP